MSFTSKHEPCQIDAVLEAKIKQFLRYRSCDASNATELAEWCAEEFGCPCWLNDDTHPLWDWVIDLLPAE